MRRSGENGSTLGNQEKEEIRSQCKGHSREENLKVWRQSEDPKMSATFHLSDLRIVLLGCLESGKSSAGNTILGREEFDLKRTAQCVKRQGDVAGRHITVVEAPGWLINQLVEESTELCKQEIVLSVSLCPPGPQALLLVIYLSIPFTENDRNELEKHMKLLTERVWSHTIVVFTQGDCLGDTPIEQHIEREGKALQWLVEKCGNRYHVLNNENRADDIQVTELLEKIEEMVAANSGHHFEMDRKILQEVEEKRRAVEERAKQRMEKVLKQRKNLRAKMGDKPHLSQLRIVLLGYRYAGKSSAGNTILGREEFEIKRTAQCVKRQGKVAGRHITVVEAPGWWRNVRVEDSPELLEHEIEHSVSLCPPGPHCLLLVIRVGSKFKAKQRSALEGHLKVLKMVWSHILVLFTCGDYLGDTPIEQHIESEGNVLQCLVEKCGNRYHVLNNKNRRDHTQVTELLEKIEEMVAGNNGCHYEIESVGTEVRGAPENVPRKKRKMSKQNTRKLDSPTFTTQMELLEESDPATQPPAGAEVFIPDMRSVDMKDNSLYRFLCSRAGQFQCKLTSLVFEMEGKGEVLYGIERWDPHLLDGLGQMRPAGPLYDIKCFEGPVSQLHLPHCEISSEGKAGLAVAHITKGNLEIIDPLNVTNTHVIIAMQGLSLFGLVTRIFSASPISAQVLLFYRLITSRQNWRELHIHLLPGNVPLTEVKSQYTGFTHIKTSSKCKLTPGRKYRSICEPYESQPEVATFERDHDPNYHPAFVVHAEAERVTVSLLDEDGTEVWKPHHFFLTDDRTEAAILNKGTGVEFVDKNREELIKRVSLVVPIADGLRSKKMMNKEMYDDIQSKTTSQKQMRTLYDALDSGGPAVKEEFYQILKDKEPFLVDDLKAEPTNT